MKPKKHLSLAEHREEGLAKRIFNELDKCNVSRELRDDIHLFIMNTTLTHFVRVKDQIYDTDPIANCETCISGYGRDISYWKDEDNNLWATYTYSSPIACSNDSPEDVCIGKIIAEGDHLEDIIAADPNLGLAEVEGKFKIISKEPAKMSEDKKD